MADPIDRDEYEHYNYEQEKYVKSGNSGKGRTKKEAEQHTNHPDPGGHTRKTTQKLINSHEKEKAANLSKGPQSSKPGSGSKAENEEK